MMTQTTDVSAHAQAALDLRQRQHHDGGIDRGHQDARHDHGQGEAGPGGAGGSRRGSGSPAITSRTVLEEATSLA